MLQSTGSQRVTHNLVTEQQLGSWLQNGPWETFQQRPQLILSSEIFDAGDFSLWSDGPA